MTASVYLLVGPDRPRKLKRVAALAASMDVSPFDRHDVIAGDCPPPHLASLVRAYPLTGPRRLIVVDDAHRLNPEGWAVLAEAARDARAVSCVVVLCDEELPREHPARSLGPGAAIEDYPLLSDAELSSWLRKTLEARQRCAGPAAIEELLRRFGADGVALRLALEQLLAWVGERAQIELEDVRAVCAGTRPSSAEEPFAFANAMARRDAVTALGVVEERLADGEHELELLGSLAWQLTRWLSAAQARREGLTVPQTAAALGMSAWQAERVLADVRGRSVEELAQSLQACWQLDVDAKSGRSPARLGLERMIVALCVRRICETDSSLRRLETCGSVVASDEP